MLCHVQLDRILAIEVTATIILQFASRIFLIATILESRDDYNFAYCPRCLEKENLSLIPLSPHEVNEMSH